jgi:hypothetical protein
MKVNLPRSGPGWTLRESQFPAEDDARVVLRSQLDFRGGHFGEGNDPAVGDALTPHDAARAPVRGALGEIALIDFAPAIEGDWEKEFEKNQPDDGKRREDDAVAFPTFTWPAPRYEIGDRLPLLESFAPKKRILIDQTRV